MDIKQSLGVNWSHLFRNEISPVFRNDTKNQNLILVEIMSVLNSSIACYHSVQKLLSSHLPSKSVKIKIYKTIILLVVLYGCEA
jgi:hypothetical protein